MAKYLVLFIFGALVFDPAAHGQFGGANIAASIGNAAGRRISDQINSSLSRGTRGFGTGGKAAQGKGTPGGPAAGAAKAAAANVPPPPPPPPPLHRVVASNKKLTAPAWMTERPFVGPPAPPPPPLNVDLASIERGMARDSLLALGKPSSKITLYEDGHMVEIYQYRNQTLASGTVRLRDGAVSAIEARP